MTILLVDDEKQVLDGMLRGVDFSSLAVDMIYTARSGEEARDIIRAKKIDILVTDIEMADMSGLDLLQWVREQGYPILAIYCTAFRNFDYAKKALQLQAFDYFLKPVSYSELTEKLRNAIASLSGQSLSPVSADTVSEETPSPRHNRSTIKKVLAYIDEHIGEELTRADLAGLVYMNPDYLGTIFKEEMGVSITIYIQDKRLSLAKELLLTTDWPISKIAETVGYDNTSYFSKLFRQKTGLQPSEYRRNPETEGDKA